MKKTRLPFKDSWRKSAHAVGLSNCFNGLRSSRNLPLIRSLLLGKLPRRLSNQTKTKANDDIPSTRTENSVTTHRFLSLFNSRNENRRRRRRRENHKYIHLSFNSRWLDRHTFLSKRRNSILSLSLSLRRRNKRDLHRPRKSFIFLQSTLQGWCIHSFDKKLIWTTMSQTLCHLKREKESRFQHKRNNAILEMNATEIDGHSSSWKRRVFLIALLDHLLFIKPSRCAMPTFEYTQKVFFHSERKSYRLYSRDSTLQTSLRWVFSENLPKHLLCSVVFVALMITNSWSEYPRSTVR